MGQTACNWLCLYLTWGLQMLQRLGILASVLVTHLRDILWCRLWCIALTMRCLQVGELLGHMIPSNVRVDVQTSSFSSISDASVQQEPWFGMPYISNPIPAETLSQWESSSLSPELQLPPQNDFLPTDFTLRSDDTATATTSGGDSTSANGQGSTRSTRSQSAQKPQSGSAAQVGQKHSKNGNAVNSGSKEEAEQNGSQSATPPDMICNELGLRLWHKLDRQYQTPKAAAYFCITSAAMCESPAAAATTHLLLKLLEDALCETAYLADVAGLSYDVGTHPSLCARSLLEKPGCLGVLWT